MTHKLPPGPPVKFFGLNQISKFRQDQIMNTFEECARTYGDVVRISFGGFPQTMVFHPDYVRQLLIDEPETITRSHFQTRLLRVFHGNSLVNSEGDFWKRQRRLAQPAFHNNRLRVYAENMVDDISRFINRWQIGKTYDMSEEMIHLTLGNVSHIFFGADVTATAAQIETTLNTIQEYVMRKAPALLPLPIWIPLPHHRKTQQAIRDLRALVMNFIQARRASGEDSGDLLSMLLMAMDEDNEHGGGQMTDMQARDEAVSMLIVGHQTTANALTWALYEIAEHPEVEAKLLAELNMLLAGRAPSMQETRQLKYLDMVIKESLRLHPPSFAMPRDAVQDIHVGEYVIPKGTGILFSQQVMHRDVRWFPEPDRFLPERFTEGWENKVPKCAYMPFGIGPHHCIGQGFATVEMHVILAMILQRYRLSLVPGQEIVASPLISQRPRDGLFMTVQEREAISIGI
jgi:cytochrome P450